MNNDERLVTNIKKIIVAYDRGLYGVETTALKIREELEDLDLIIDPPEPV